MTTFTERFLAESIDEFKKAIALDSRFPRVHYYLGLTYLYKDGAARIPDAMEEFKIELAANPEEYFANFYLGILYIMDRKFEPAIALLERIGDKPDIVHLNDWPCGFASVELRARRRHEPFFADTRVLFSIHNLAYQGAFDPENLWWMDFAAYRDAFMLDGAASALKAGIVAVLTIMLSGPLAAQWLGHPTAGIPRTPDGKPNLKAPPPRLPDGRPDISGLWAKASPKYSRNIVADLKSHDDVPGRGRDLA